MKNENTNLETGAKMPSCVHSNTKTIETVDFTTDCPKRRAGKPCKYCYVEVARRKGFNAKKVYNYLKYNNEVKRYSNERIQLLNSAGGTRLFSFGDYMPEHDTDIQAFLDDCQSRGLKVKVITKQPDFIHKFHNHPAIVVINVSIDNVGDGIDWALAKTLKAAYSKVKIRCAIMKDEDIQVMAESDVFTFNHATGGKKYGWKKYSKEEINQWNEKLGGRVCCTTKNGCRGCSLKCGQ